jgi:hypothetical protein
MPILFRSHSMAATFKPRGGAEVPGRATWQARVVAPEDNAIGVQVSASVATLRRDRLGSDGSLREPPPPEIVGATDAIVPSSLIEALPDDALLRIEWEFTPS